VNNRSLRTRLLDGVTLLVLIGIILSALLLSGCNEPQPTNCLNWCKEYIHNEYGERYSRVDAGLEYAKTHLPVIAVIDSGSHAVAIVGYEEGKFWVVDNGFSTSMAGQRAMWSEEELRKRLTYFYDGHAIEKAVAKQ